MSKSVLTITLVSLLCCVTFVASQRRYTIDYKIPFYTDISLTCDHPELNITKRSDVQSLSWVFPDGRAIYPDSYLNPRFFELTGPASDVTTESPRANYGGYNLTLFEIDYDVFGYYMCIVVYTQDSPVSVIRVGVNENGADFSELEEAYREGAIVGGIAAAVLFVICVGGCVIWQYCFADDTGVVSDDSDIEVKKGNDVISHKEHVYSNQSYAGDGMDSADPEKGPRPKSVVNTKL